MNENGSGLSLAVLKLEPFAPVHAVADAIGILRRRLQIHELYAVVVGRTQVAVVRRRRGRHFLRVLREARPVLGNRDLGEALLIGRVGPPGDRLRAGRIALPRSG